MAEVVNLFIDGRPVAARADGAVDVWDPATGETIARTPLCGAEDVDRAVRAAERAFPDWAATPVVERARVLFRAHALLEKHSEELARLVVRENGKHIDDARGEVLRGLEVVELACGMPSLMMGDSLMEVSRGVDTVMYRYPLGVVGGVTPFNFPVMIPLWMAPLAIAAGNTFVLKPSQRTPLGGMRLAELFAEAGLPDGVFNVVHGAAEATNALIDHAAVRAISFVGSAAVASQVYARAAARGKRVQALAGAKNHVVIMPDADVETTAVGLFGSAFGNAGERCMAGSVAVMVGDSEPILERFLDLARSTRVADGLTAGSGPVLTPLTTEEHRRRVEEWIETGIREGAQVLLDGRGQRREGGFFLGPTVLDRVRPDMTVAQEEIFGPVLCVERMDGLEEAVETINRSRYGNGAVIFTRSGWAARYFQHHVQAGMIGVNVGVPAPMAWFPFAGWKGSFFGDLHANGRDGVEFYTERRVVTSRWPLPGSGA